MENQLDNLRKGYLTIPLPEKPTESWEKLEKNLTGQITPTSPILLKTVIMLFGTLLLLSGTVVVAQASGPGDTLYPVKVISDNLVAKATGNYSPVFEKRAQEILNSTNKSPEKMGQALQEYNKALEEAQGQKGSQILRQTLKDQEDKFKDLIKKEPSSGALLEETIQKSAKLRGEVKGIKKEKKPINLPRISQKSGKHEGKD